MSAAVTLNLSINYTLIELLCTFVNLEEIRKEIYKMILKKDNEKRKVVPPKSRIRSFFNKFSRMPFL